MELCIPPHGQQILQYLTVVIVRIALQQKPDAESGSLQIPVFEAVDRFLSVRSARQPLVFISTAKSRPVPPPHAKVGIPQIAISAPLSDCQACSNNQRPAVLLPYLSHSALLSLSLFASDLLRTVISQLNRSRLAAKPLGCT